MQTPEWIATGAALFSAIAAVINAFIAVRWGKEFARAKEAQIQAKDSIISEKEIQIETIKSAQENLLREKESQIETLRNQIELLGQFNPPILREYFVSVREQLEEYNKDLSGQLDDARKTIAEKDTEIDDLKQGHSNYQIDIKQLQEERCKLEKEIISLQKEQQEILAEQNDLRSKEQNLSERQAKILEFVRTFALDNGFPPTISEIGKAVNIHSKSVINYNLDSLSREGLIYRDRTVSRGINLVERLEPLDGDS